MHFYTLPGQGKDILSFIIRTRPMPLLGNIPHDKTSTMFPTKRSPQMISPISM